jgi:dTDP-4-amino-4,6-dideoxygalactose transaminase
MPKIPFFIPSINNQDIESVKKTLEKKWISQGKISSKFEKKFADKLKTKPNKCVGVTNGFSALYLASILCNLKENDEVLIPSINFVASANIFSNLNAKIVFVDCESNDNPNISVSDLKKKLSKKTKIVVVMHYGGYPCNMDKIMKLKKKYKFKLIEDSCHAVFSSYKNKMLGTFGDFSAFSFYANKNITSCEGGLIYCKKDKDAKKIRILKNHGLSRTSLAHSVNSKSKYDVLQKGFNFRLDDVRSSMLVTQLKRINQNTVLRHKIFKSYIKYIKNNKIKILFTNFNRNNYSRHLFVISSKFKNKITKMLKKKGIGFSQHYKPTHMLKAHKTSVNLKNSEFFFKKSISLPIYPDLKIAQVKKISNILNTI